MKAAILHEAKMPLTIEEVTLREPRSSEVLVRTAVSGVCHTDLHMANGHWEIETPAVLGHEATGTVEAVGESVRYVHPGDRVLLSGMPLCGRCNFCLSGRPYLCRDESLREMTMDRLSWNGRPVTQYSFVSSFAEYMLTVETGVVKLPQTMPFAEATLIGCGVMTGVGAALYTARVPGGAVAAVIGCGGVGLSIVQGCRIAGASRILAIDLLDHRLELARAMGATDVINASKVDPVEVAKDLTADGVEFAFEAIGNVDAARQTFDMVQRGGTAVIVGGMPAGAEIRLPGLDFLWESKNVIGCLYGSTRFREHMPKLMSLYQQGHLKLSEMISKRYRLDEINESFQAMARGEVLRPMIDFPA